MSRLSFTSALVLLWTEGKIHTSRSAREFLGMLDLGAGMDAMERCDRFWPHYPDLIKNRKSCILNIARRHVDDCNDCNGGNHTGSGNGNSNNSNSNNSGVRQIVSLGAGMDALSVELCSRSRTCRAFDIDESLMPEKQRLVDSLQNAPAGTLRCINADASCPGDVMSGLEANGWDKAAPTLVVIEGLSYYLGEQELWGVIEGFRTPGLSNRVVMEYMLPRERIAAESRGVSEFAFDIIAQSHDGMSPVTLYDLDGITSRLDGMGAHIRNHYTMEQMERNRTGTNSVFGSRRMPGWVEICEFAL